MENKEWFETWFDSPFYHILYDKRSDKEAYDFVANFFEKYLIESNSSILDLACGKGRLSRALAEKGNHVIGVDLSEESIQAAQEFANEQLQFYVHDMRKLFRTNYFDLIFNFFTSFGYFKTESENHQVLRNIHRSLKPGGMFVIDYFNFYKVAEKLVSEEIVTKQNIDFKISRKITDKDIIKNINFEYEGKKYAFQESVSAFTYSDLTRMLQQNQFEIINTVGSYSLENYDKNNSDRVILIAKKK